MLYLATSSVSLGSSIFTWLSLHTGKSLDHNCYTCHSLNHRGMWHAQKTLKILQTCSFRVLCCESWSNNVKWRLKGKVAIKKFSPNQSFRMCFFLDSILTQHKACAVITVLLRLSVMQASRKQASPVSVLSAMPTDWYKKKNSRSILCGGNRLPCENETGRLSFC